MSVNKKDTKKAQKRKVNLRFTFPCYMNNQIFFSLLNYTLHENDQILSYKSPLDL